MKKNGNRSRAGMVLRESCFLSFTEFLRVIFCYVKNVTNRYAENQKGKTRKMAKLHP